MSDLSLSVRTSDAGTRPRGKRSYMSSSVMYPPGHRPPPAAAPSRLQHRLAPLVPPQPLNYRSTTGRAAMWAEAMQQSHAAPPPRPDPVTGGQTPGQPPPTVVAAPPPPKPVVDVAAARAQVRKAASQIVQSKVLTALMVFLITVLLLVCINPPMAQDAVTQEDKAAGRSRGKRSAKKIMVWSLLVFTLALILPVAASYLPARSPPASPEL